MMLLWFQIKLLISILVEIGDFVVKAFIFCLMCYAIFVVVVWVMRGLVSL